MWSGTAADGNQNFREGNVRLDCAKFCRYPPDHKHSTKIGAGMSSLSIRKPGFRLLLGYPDIILTRDDAAEPVGSAAPGSDRFGADLRRLAAEVLRCGGRLTVVLPASEVWRGQVDPGGRAPRAEWRAARARAAAALGVDADALRTVVGRSAARGPVPAVAVRRSTLAEVRTLLASVGLKPSAIVGAGAFEGFAAPPQLCGRWAPPPVGQRRALAGAGGLAVAVIALMVMGLRPDTPTVAPASVAVASAVVATAAPVAPAPATTVAVVAPPAVKPAEPVRLVRADPPRARPARLVPAGAATQPVATLGTRSVPMVFVEDKGKPAAALRLAELTDPRGPLTDVAIPLRRPAATPAPLAAGALEPLPALRPEPRPGRAAARAETPAVAPRAVEASAPAPAGEPPMPRPGAEPVRVASLGDQVSDAVIAASVMTPLARPEDTRAAAPRPVPAVAAAPKPAAPKPAAPKPVAAAPRVVAPAPKLAAAPVVAQPVVKRAPQPAPTVQRVVRVEEKRPVRAAQPVRVAAVPAPKTKPVVAPMRVAAAVQAPTVRRQNKAAAAGFGSRASRDDVALIGVFGGSDGRKALIRLPNGKIRKVQAGDSVQGIEIAAIGSDSVRVTDGRRESVLEMPD